MEWAITVLTGKYPFSNPKLHEFSNLKRKMTKTKNKKTHRAFKLKNSRLRKSKITIPHAPPIKWNSRSRRRSKPCEPQGRTQT
jgi:hypothetical protein